MTGAIVRALYLFDYHGSLEWSLLTVDNYYHHNWAQDIANGNVLGDTTYFRAPLYVFCLATIYAVLGPSVLAARIFGLMLGLVSVYVTFRLGRRLFSNGIGLAAALLQALYPVMIYFEAELLLDPLFMLLLQLAVFAMISWHADRRTTRLIAIGLLIGLAALTRPTALILIPIALFMVARQGAMRPWALKNAVLMLAGAVLIIGPVFVRNIYVAGDPVLIASQGGINLYLGNNEEADGLSAVMPEPPGHNWRIRDVTYLAEHETGRHMRPGEVSTFWTQRAASWIIHYPLDFIGLYVKKLYFTIGDIEISNNRLLGQFFRAFPILRYNPLSFGVIFPFLLIGFVLAWKRKPATRVVLVTVVLYMLVTALFFVSGRFRLPLMPLFILLAAYGAWACFQMARRSVSNSTGIVAAVVLLAGVSFYPVYGQPGKQSVMGLLAAGRHYYDRNEYSEALSYYQRALRTDPQFPETHLNVAACYFRLGIGDSVLNYLDEEKRLHPGRADAFINAASYYLVNGDYGRALQEARAALSRKPYDVNANRILVRAAASDAVISDHEFSTVVNSATRASDNDLLLLVEAATLLSERRDMISAESLLTRAISTEPPPIETDDLAFSGIFAQARSNWMNEKAKAFYQLGYLKGLSGSYGQAVQYSRAAVRINPFLTEAYVNLISGHKALGHAETADSILQEALILFPDNQTLRLLKYGQ